MPHCLSVTGLNVLIPPPGVCCPECPSGCPGRGDDPGVDSGDWDHCTDHQRPRYKVTHLRKHEIWLFSLNSGHNLYPCGIVAPTDHRHCTALVAATAVSTGDTRHPGSPPIGHKDYLAWAARRAKLQVVMSPSLVTKQPGLNPSFRLFPPLPPSPAPLISASYHFMRHLPSQPSPARPSPAMLTRNDERWIVQTQSSSSLWSTSTYKYLNVPLKLTDIFSFIPTFHDNIIEYIRK